MNPVESPSTSQDPLDSQRPLDAGEAAPALASDRFTKCAGALLRVAVGLAGEPQKSEIVEGVGRGGRCAFLGAQVGGGTRGGAWGELRKEEPAGQGLVDLRADRSRLRSSRFGPAAAANAHLL